MSNLKQQTLLVQILFWIDIFDAESKVCLQLDRQTCALKILRFLHDRILQSMYRCPPNVSPTVMGNIWYYSQIESTDAEATFGIFRNAFKSNHPLFQPIASFKVLACIQDLDWLGICAPGPTVIREHSTFAPRRYNLLSPFLLMAKVHVELELGAELIRR